MEKIAYVELDTHPEIVTSFAALIEDSASFKADFFLSKKIAKQVQLSPEQNVVIWQPGNLLFQLFKEDYKLVIIGTLHRRFNVFQKIIGKFNTAVIVHNQNFVKTSKYGLWQAIFKKEFLFRAKLLSKEALLQAPHLYQEVNYLLVLDPRFENKNQKYFPVFYNEFLENTRKEFLTIVIPGTVSQWRRDYEHVLSEIPKFKTSTCFIFLGKAALPELDWLRSAENRLPSHLKIQYFTEKVQQNEFDEIMNSADVLWCPIQEKTEFFSGLEIYGQTKMSGNIGDAIKYGKPAVFPKAYQSFFSFIFKEETNIEAQFLRLSKERPDFSKFNKSTILVELEATLRQLLSS